MAGFDAGNYKKNRAGSAQRHGGKLKNREDRTSRRMRGRSLTGPAIRPGQHVLEVACAPGTPDAAQRIQDSALSAAEHFRMGDIIRIPCEEIIATAGSHRDLSESFRRYFVS